jgi:hypothetical protein
MLSVMLPRQVRFRTWGGGSSCGSPARLPGSAEPGFGRRTPASRVGGPRNPSMLTAPLSAAAIGRVQGRGAHGDGEASGRAPPRRFKAHPPRAIPYTKAGRTIPLELCTTTRWPREAKTPWHRLGPKTIYDSMGPAREDGFPYSVGRPPSQLLFRTYRVPRPSGAESPKCDPVKSGFRRVVRSCGNSTVASLHAERRKH